MENLAAALGLASGQRVAARGCTSGLSTISNGTLGLTSDASRHSEGHRIETHAIDHPTAFSVALLEQMEFIIARSCSHMQHLEFAQHPSCAKPGKGEPLVDKLLRHGAPRRRIVHR